MARLGRLKPALPVVGVLSVAVFARFWALTAVGFNSDEAVYTGSAASLAGDHVLSPMFPVFRAHPILFQTLLSLVLRVHDTDWTARALAAAIGVATVAVTLLLGRRLYGTRAGLLAGLLLAVMPYHVIVSRQVLLDGLMTLCATTALYCVVRYVESARQSWLLAGGGMLGAAILTKETSVVLVGGLYAFFALTPAARIRAKHLILTSVLIAVEVAVWPLTLRLAGHASTGQSYLMWQLFRRPNHGTWFYLTVLPNWIGPTLLVAALAGLIWLRHEATWRERLLLTWLVVPVLFFTMWPVKGFEYLLPVCPPLAVLAGRTLANPLPRWRWPARPRWLTLPASLTLPRWRWPARPRWLTLPASLTLPRWRWPARPRRLTLPASLTLPRWRWPARPRWLTLPRWLAPDRLRSRVPNAGRVVMAGLTAITVISLGLATWARIAPSGSTSFLAGSGGLNGGRETGDWILHHVPRGARLLAIGPSAANVLEFYGHHHVSALSVSTDPRDRNPAYVPVANPDLALRRGVFQYVVWDAYTASRTTFFASIARRLATKYHGVVVFVATTKVPAASGSEVAEPVFVVYKVHP